MRKINKIINIAVIFMLSMPLAYIDIVYSFPCSLRIPIQGSGRLNQVLEKKWKSILSRCIRKDNQGYPHEKTEYTSHLNGNLPRPIVSLMFKLNWPLDMTRDGYLWHFHGSLYKFHIYSPRHHKGIDILLAEESDTDIRAVSRGKIIYIFNEGERAYGILVRSDNGLVCCYHHIAAKSIFKKSIFYEPKWKIGRMIKTGQLVGSVAYCPRPLLDYKDLDARSALPFKPHLLATRLHFQTWYFPPSMSDEDVRSHILNKGMMGELSENEFNPLLILKPLYLIPLPDQSHLVPKGTIIESVSSARTCQ